MTKQNKIKRRKKATSVPEAKARINRSFFYGPYAKYTAEQPAQTDTKKVGRPTVGSIAENKENVEWLRQHTPKELETFLRLRYPNAKFIQAAFLKEFPEVVPSALSLYLTRGVIRGTFATTLRKILTELNQPTHAPTPTTRVERVAAKVEASTKPAESLVKTTDELELYKKLVDIYHELLTMRGDR